MKKMKKTITKLCSPSLLNDVVKYKSCMQFCPLCIQKSCDTNRKGLVRKVKLSSVMTNAATKTGGKHGKYKSGTLNSLFVFAAR